MWNSVEEFRDWYLKNGCPWRPTFESPVFFTDNAMSLCLYREGKFQVELYISKPSSTTPAHTHPGVDSAFVYLTGNLSLHLDGKDHFDSSIYQKENPDGTHMMLGRTMSSPDGVAHWLDVGKEGGAFLSFEYWKEKSPDSVTMNWKGDPVGEIHKGILQS